ncbi:hypothetical protein O0L34_g12687 [Tuta absoluta]|nr:hypothetical protein O0L34_g12687 [Tuta absoluta]
MEESINEGELNTSYRSPPRRRRSTFFDRRESFVPQPMSENEDPNVCKQTTDASEKKNEELTKYYDKLLEEKDQWKKEVNRRRIKYHDLRQQYTMALKAPGRSRMSYSTLTDEDIEFLKAKANTSQLVESQQKLHESLIRTRALYRRKNELDNEILMYCEQRVDKITEYILENSTVYPTDNS